MSCKPQPALLFPMAPPRYPSGYIFHGISTDTGNGATKHDVNAALDSCWPIDILPGSPLMAKHVYFFNDEGDKPLLDLLAGTYLPQGHKIWHAEIQRA